MPGFDAHLLLDALKMNSQISDDEKQVMLNQFIQNVQKYEMENKETVEGDMYDVTSLSFNPEKALNDAIESKGKVKLPMLGKPWRSLQLWQEKVLGQ